MKGLTLVVGAGGIVIQLAKDLSESEKDLEDSQSLLQLKNKISNHPNF